MSLTLICRSSYRGVVEFINDIFGLPLSVGTVHNLHQAAAQTAETINRSQDLSGIRVGLHDEIYQGNQPVLAGVDAKSTYCYLLAAEEHRDAATWAIHLLTACDQGFNPDHTVADQGKGLCAGQKLVWSDKPCHGDVFHISHECERLANTLANVAKGAKTQRQKLQDQAGKVGKNTPELAEMIVKAIEKESKLCDLARDIRTLMGWALLNNSKLGRNATRIHFTFRQLPTLACQDLSLHLINDIGCLFFEDFRPCSKQQSSYEKSS